MKATKYFSMPLTRISPVKLLHIDSIFFIHKGDGEGEWLEYAMQYNFSCFDTERGKI